MFNIFKLYEIVTCREPTQRSTGSGRKIIYANFLWHESQITVLIERKTLTLH